MLTVPKSRRVSPQVREIRDAIRRQRRATSLTVLATAIGMSASWVNGVLSGTIPVADDDPRLKHLARRVGLETREASVDHGEL